MPQSLAHVVLHTVFSTKHRQPFLRNADVRQELHAYLARVLQGIRCPALLINGVDDHIHMVHVLSRTVTIADLVEQAKTASSKWLKQQDRTLHEFQWQSGYETFSVSESNVPQVKEYVSDQEAHHQKMNFQEEFRALCNRHGVAIDERYVWD
ncbi:MAG: transposase [Verrucomicrobia bacterium]|nr:transposase [Verrucomicrobiota bacterium]